MKHIAFRVMINVHGFDDYNELSFMWHCSYRSSDILLGKDVVKAFPSENFLSFLTVQGFRRDGCIM